MKVIRVVALLGFLAMTGIIIYAFVVGDFSAEGAILLAMPWGVVSMVDLYVGFALFSCWIVYREKAVLPSIIWVLLMLTLGSWTAALYTLIALYTSKNDWRRFWMGKRA